MSKVRILFLGTPEFAVASLERLIADDHYEIVGVVTQPDRPAGRKMQLTPSPVKVLALKHGLTVFSPESVNKEEFLEKIRPLGAEAAVVVAFGQILSQKFLDTFPQGAVNVHGSLLPRWRGAAPIQRSLMAGDAETGVALQRVVKKLDAGPVLGIRKLVVTDEMDAMTVHDDLKVLGADLLHIEFMDFLRGNLMPHEQDESLVTFAPKIEKAEARIDWNQPARVVFNKIRGLMMGPIPQTTRAGQMVKIHRTRPLEGEKTRGVPGEVVRVETNLLWVACSSGVLEILELQPESRAKMPVADFLRGYPLKAGDKFE